MDKTLTFSMETGKLDLPALTENLDEAQAEAQTLEIAAKVNAGLDEIEPLASTQPEEALKQLWVGHILLESHPVRYVKNYGKRGGYNATKDRLTDLKAQALQHLPEGQGAKIWESLPFIRDCLELLFPKFKARGDVMRLILTPLGNLEHAEIRYQRDEPQDLMRVCREIQEHIAKTSHLDDQVLAWGPANFPALLAGTPPNQIPPALQPPLGGALAPLLLGVGLLVGGVTLLIGGNIPVGAGLLVVGIAAAAFGGLKTQATLAERAKLPQEFPTLATQFRERMYLICALRELLKVASSFNRASDAFDRYLQDNGGVQRWKEAKLDQRNLTLLFADDAADWHPKQTIEGWLNDKVTQAFRLEAQTLTSMEQIDPQAWEVILRAYLLETTDTSESSEARLLDTVAELLFTRRGEDSREERDRVFQQVYSAWDQRAAG